MRGRNRKVARAIEKSIQGKSAPKKLGFFQFLKSLLGDSEQFKIKKREGYG